MTQPNEEVLREIVSNAIYRKSFNLLIQNEQLNVLDWSGKVMDVFTRQCEEMRKELEQAKKELERVREITVDTIKSELIMVVNKWMGEVGTPSDLELKQAQAIHALINQEKK